MEPKNKKEEEKKPEDNADEKSKQDEGANSVEDRIAAVEAKVDQLIESVTASKQDDEEDNPEEDKKKEEEKEPEGEPKPEEDKKKEEEEEEEEDKKKEEAEPKPGEGEVKLPQAPAGETDEDAKPEDDKVDVVEKKVEDIMKSKGWIPAGKTPRAGHEIAKRKEEEPENLAMDLLNKAKNGEITVADLNRTVKGFVNKNYTAALRMFIEKGRKEVA